MLIRMFEPNLISKFSLYFSHHICIHFFMSICSPSPWPYRELMNMHDHFTYCVTFALNKQSLKEALAQAFSTR